MCELWPLTNDDLLASRRVRVDLVRSLLCLEQARTAMDLGPAQRLVFGSLPVEVVVMVG